jgi:hypothetical protein
MPHKNNIEIKVRKSKTKSWLSTINTLQISEPFTTTIRSRKHHKIKQETKYEIWLSTAVKWLLNANPINLSFRHIIDMHY